MDLRPYRLSGPNLQFAAQVLNYQPFIISDDIQTGVAHSWLHVKDVEDVPQTYPMVMQRSQVDPDTWEKFVSANARLRAMYDDWTKLLAERFPGGSMLDVACNNGYFLVRSEMFGMGPGLGIDLNAGYAASIGFLNLMCGTRAGFLHAPYDPARHAAALDQQFDVVVASNILPHMPDPAHFIGYLGQMARKAVFLWTCIIDTPELLVKHMRPTAMWGPQGPEQLSHFPNCFNRGALVSRGLVDFAFESMGFRDVTYLPEAPTWLPGNMKENFEPKILSADVPPEAHEGFHLINELRGDAKMMAVLACR